MDQSEVLNGLQDGRTPNNNGHDRTLLKLQEQCVSSADVIRSLHANFAVKCAIISEPFLKSLPSNRLSQFWQTLFGLPKLKYLHCLAMKDRSFHFLFETIRLRKPLLKNIRLIDLTISSEETPLASFVKVLSDIPTLEAVHVNMSPPDGATANTSICAIFRSNCLGTNVTWMLDLIDERTVLMLEAFQQNADQFSSLEVSGVDLAGTAVDTIAQILLCSATLDKLHLSLQMLSAHAYIIANALKQNDTLRELSVLISGTPEMFRVAPIAEALQINTGLQWLQVSSHLVDDTSALAFADALKLNNTLKVLDFSLDIHSLIWITDKGYQALLCMLEVNHVLEMMPTYGLENEKMQSKIGYYLKMNDCGIRSVQLYGNTTKRQFIHVLAEQSEDEIDCIYYLLLNNPLIFNNFT